MFGNARFVFGLLSPMGVVTALNLQQRGRQGVMLHQLEWTTNVVEQTALGHFNLWPLECLNSLD